MQVVLVKAIIVYYKGYGHIEPILKISRIGYTKMLRDLLSTSKNITIWTLYHFYFVVWEKLVL